MNRTLPDGDLSCDEYSKKHCFCHWLRKNHSSEKCHSIIVIIIMIINNSNNSNRFAFLSNSLTFYIKYKDDKAVSLCCTSGTWFWDMHHISRLFPCLMLSQKPDIFMDFLTKKKHKSFESLPIPFLEPGLQKQGDGMKRSLVT